MYRACWEGEIPADLPSVIFLLRSSTYGGPDPHLIGPNAASDPVEYANGHALLASAAPLPRPKIPSPRGKRCATAAGRTGAAGDDRDLVTDDGVLWGDEAAIQQRLTGRAASMVSSWYPVPYRDAGPERLEKLARWLRWLW